jgi:predicted nucleotidyltransferase
MAGEMNFKTDVVENIRTALRNSPDLVAVYLFGSMARDEAHALSDVDVAVLFADELSAAAVFAGTLEIGVILDEALRRPVGVIALNRAPPALCFQVLKHGRLLLEKDRTQRCVFVMDALGQYYDAKPYRDCHNTRLLSRIREEGLGGGYHNILVRDYLEIDGTIVHRNLTEELEDFDQFSNEIIARFLSSDSSAA